MELKDLIKNRRLELGLTLEEVGNIVGVSKATVLRWESGEIQNMRREKIAKLAQALVTTPEYLMGWGENEAVEISPYKPKGLMPKLGRVAAGMPIFAEDNIECYIACDYNDEYQYYALTVHGDSMNAAGIDDGDIVIVRQQDVVDTNQIAVVLVNGYDATIKYYHQSGKTVILTPKSYNTDHQPQIYDASKIAIKIIGRVVEVRKSL